MRTRLLPPLLLLLLTTLLHAQPEKNERYILAQRYERNGDLKNAAAVYLELYRSDPATAAYFDGVRRTMMASRRYEELLPVAQQHLRLHRTDVDLHLLVAELLHRMERRDEALAMWRTTTQIGPADRGLWRRVALTQQMLGLHSEALATLDAGREQMNDPVALPLEHAELLAHVGRIEESVAEYATLLRSQPELLALAQRGLASSLDGRGTRRAIPRLRSEVDSSPDTTLLQMLAWLHGEVNDYDGMFAAVERLDALGSDRGRALAGLADRLARNEQWAPAGRAWQMLLDRHGEDGPFAPNARFGLIRAAEGEAGNPDTLPAATLRELAGRYLSVVTRTGPGNRLSDTAAYRAAILLARDDPERALTLLDRIGYPPGSGTSTGRFGLLRAGLMVRTNNLEPATALLREIAYDSRDTVVADAAAFQLGRMYFYRGEFDSAMNTYVGLTNDLGSEVANDALAELTLIQENRGRNDTALALYARGELARIQRRTRDAATFHTEAERSAGRSPLAERALMAHAELLEETGEANGAVALYRRLVENHPSGLFADRALYRAARLLERGGSRAESDTLYMKILTDYPLSPHVDEAREAMRRK